MKIEISVIIPVYGVEKYIKQCMESVVNQTMKDIEIIVVNDGTTDNSMKIVEEFLYDKRIKIINKQNGGISSARNAGLDIARGKYVYFLDSDDYIESNALNLLYKQVEDAEIIFTDFTFLYKNGIKEKKKFRTLVKRENIEKGCYFFINDLEASVLNRLYERKFLVDNGLRFIEGIINEDQHFSFKSLMLAEKVKYIESYSYVYRKFRNGSITSTSKKIDVNKAYEKIIKEFTCFYNSLGTKDIDSFKKLRIFFRIQFLSLIIKENNNEFLKNEFNKIEKLIFGYFEKNKFSFIEREIVILDFRNILKLKSLIGINLFNKFYWKYKIFTFKLLRKIIKRKIKYIVREI